MIFASLSLLLASTAAFAINIGETGPVLRCSFLPTDPNKMDAAETNFRRTFSAMNFTIDAATISPPIPVVWHVIQKNDDYYGGNVPDSQIKGTIDALNSQFGSSGISFTLTKTTRTTNADWFSNVGDGSQGGDAAVKSQTAMKAQLREGDVTTLNVYTVGFESDLNLGGITTFPWEYSASPKNDGIVLRYNTLQGGTRRYFDEGKILTHNVGHWLGLWDVFQGACSGGLDGGDHVWDTPAQSGPTIGCPWFSTSCFLNPNSFHNYMDYSFDKCKHEFTDGQIVRIKNQILTYRGIQVG